MNKHKCVELLRERRAGVMTEQLALGTVDDPNKAFELLLREMPPQDLIFRELEQEAILADQIPQPSLSRAALLGALSSHPLRVDRQVATHG
jgi:hypothetical protein